MVTSAVPDRVRRSSLNLRHLPPAERPKGRSGPKSDGKKVHILERVEGPHLAPAGRRIVRAGARTLRRAGEGGWKPALGCRQEQISPQKVRLLGQATA